MSVFSRKWGVELLLPMSLPMQLGDGTVKSKDRSKYKLCCKLKSQKRSSQPSKPLLSMQGLPHPSLCVFLPSEKHLDFGSPYSYNPTTSGEVEHPLMCLGAPALHFMPNFGWPGRLSQIIFQIFLRVSCIPSPDICPGQLTGLFPSSSTGSPTEFCSFRI